MTATATVTPLPTAPQTVGTTQDRIRSFIERAERLHEEIDATKADLKELFGEARGEGFDVAIIKKLIALRKKDPSELAEQAEILRLYAGAAGNEQLALML